MKHMKKAILFAALCCLTFAGCGNKDSNIEDPVSTETVAADTEQTLSLIHI